MLFRSDDCFGLQEPSIHEVVHMLQRTDAYVLVNDGESPSEKATGRYKDDITGQVLRDELVHEAMVKELKYFDEKEVWTMRPKDECRRKTGKAPITVRWVIVNKGDDEQPNYRARLVARQIRHQGVESIFAPTPPLEAVRTVISAAATNYDHNAPDCRDPSSEERIQLSFIDIARAYFNAPTDPAHPTYVELPPQHRCHGDVVAPLKKQIGRASCRERV